MAKGDFNLDEEEYDIVYDENKYKNPFSKVKNVSRRRSKSKNNNLYNISIDDTSDLGDFANISFDDNNEDKQNTFGQVVSFVKGISVRTFIVIFGVILICFVITLVTVVSIERINKSYTSDIIIPDVLYMGEVSGVSVVSNYSGETISKRDITQTVSTFKIKDPNIITTLNDNAIGSQVSTVLIPMQEGRTTINVVSKLGSRVLKNVKKEVVVCPKFDSSLLLVKDISIVKNATYRLHMDLNDEECLNGITYHSNNDKVAIVDENGAVTAFNVGKTTITIKKGDKSFNVNVNVSDKSINVKNFKTNSSILQLSRGEKHRLSIDYSPSNATSFDTKFYSSNENVAKVSSGGLVTAISPGETTISVSSSSYPFNAEVKVFVSDEKSSDIVATSMTLDKTSITLTQGEVQKVNAVLTPNSLNNKIIKWVSSDENVAFVTNNGVIYARGQGNAIIEVYTDNGLKKEIKVTVKKIKAPVISSSDGIVSGKWHTKSYVLSFTGVRDEEVYYSGANQNSFNGDKLVVGKNENQTYYIAACKRICTTLCDKSIKNESSSSKCDMKCAKQPLICSETATYVSKLDLTKPTIDSVTPTIDSISNKSIIQISALDDTSLVDRWCVMNTDSFIGCKWNMIEPIANPKIDLNNYKRGTYYVFVGDVAGNISDGYKFEVNSIN